MSVGNFESVVGHLLANGEARRTEEDWNQGEFEGHTFYIDPRQGLMLGTSTGRYAPNRADLIGNFEIICR